MIFVTATARLRADRRDQALAAARRMQEVTTAERGCHEYRFWTAIDDPHSLLLFERWEDVPSLEAHLASPHVAEFGAAIGDFVDGPVSIERFHATDAEPPG
jgi:quinol monooxygenase YgiN